MATDRMNTVQDQLKTDLDATTAITDVFNLISDGIPMLADPLEWKVYDHELPALFFEVYACDDVIPSSTQIEPIYEREFGIIFILHSEATFYEIKERLKEGISQLRSWLHSDNWTYKEWTILEQSSYDYAAGGRGFMGVATVPFSVDIKT